MYSPPSPTDIFKGKTLHSAQSVHESDAHLADVKEAAAQASTLPPGLLERGTVTSKADMTTMYTNGDWQSIIDGFVEVLGPVPEQKKYKHEGELTKTIDHTLLKLDATSEQIDQLCQEARDNNFATVCVRPKWVEQCVKNLQGTDIKIASVIGFHEGTYDMSHKAQETKLSLSSGALELDIVVNYPQLQKKEYSTIYNELSSLRAQAPHPITLKLILETSQLSKSQIIAGCVLAGEADFDFIKTSTGFNGPGASVENVALMKRCAEVVAEKGEEGRVMKVKASGGVRSLADAKKMLEAGAERLGTSSGVVLAREFKQSQAGGDAGESGSVTRPQNGDAY